MSWIGGWLRGKDQEQEQQQQQQQQGQNQQAQQQPHFDAAEVRARRAAALQARANKAAQEAEAETDSHPHSHSHADTHSHPHHAAAPSTPSRQSMHSSAGSTSNEVARTQSDVSMTDASAMPVEASTVKPPTRSSSTTSTMSTTSERTVSTPVTTPQRSTSQVNVASPAGKGTAPIVSPSSPSQSSVSLPPIHPPSASAYAASRNPLPISLVFAYKSDVPMGELASVWEDAAYCSLFDVTLTPPKAVSGTTSPTRSGGRIYLPQLAEELREQQKEQAKEKKEEQSTPLLSRDHLDTVLMDRITRVNEQMQQQQQRSSMADGSCSILTLISFYRRAMELQTRLQGGLAHAESLEGNSSSSSSPSTSSSTSSTRLYPSSVSDWRACLSSMEVAVTCLVRYISLLLQDEDMFQDSRLRATQRSEFMRLLCADPTVARTLPPGLLDRLVSLLTSDEDGNVDGVFGSLISELATPLKFTPTPSMLGENMPKLDDAVRTIHGLTALLRYAPLAQLIVQHPSFLPNAPNGRLIQTVSTLGPLMSVGAASTEPEFQNVINQRAMSEVDNDVSRLRATFQSYQQLLHVMLKMAVKHAPAREKVVQWLAAVTNANAPRRKMQYHPLMVSSDQTMFNVMHVSLALTQPILRKRGNADFMKLNFHYLLQSSSSGGRIDYDPITRVVASSAEVKEKRSALSRPILFTPRAAPYTPFNFSTEIFFLTHALLDEGLSSIIRQYTEIMKELSHISRALQRMQPGDPRFEQGQQQLQRLFAMNLATRVHLQDPCLMHAVIQLYDWTSAWICFHHAQIMAENKQMDTNTPLQSATTTTTAASPNSPSASPSQPPPSASSSGIVPAPPAPSSFINLLPESFIQGMIDYFVYLGRFQSNELNSLPSSSYSSILELVLSYAAGPFALKNPHARGGLAELLLSLPSDYTTPEHAFNASPVIRERLVPSLLDLYVSVEEGRGQMYYLKYSIRHHISRLLEGLWGVSNHRAQFVAIAHANPGSAEYHNNLFNRFINVLANDLIFLLDEGLRLLAEIRETQLAMDDEATWAAQSAEEREERVRAFGQSEQGATSCLTLAHATVHLLYLLTSEIVTPFVAAEFVERMASMLDSYIHSLAGPKVSNLKVKDKEKYNFKPRELLREIVSTWLNLAHDKGFIEKVATDERSYRYPVFLKAARILHTRSLLPPRTVERFASLVDDVERASGELHELESILGEIPDEYSDALIGQLMTDPVMLPQSKQVVDRATIHRQLMNKKVDPFSNTPLTEAELIEQPALKSEIESWVADKKRQWLEQKRQKTDAQVTEENEREQQAEEQEEKQTDKAAPVESNANAAAAGDLTTLSTSNPSTPSSSSSSSS